MRLLLKTHHFRRQLGRGAELREIDKLPTLQLRTIAEIQILRQRIVLPAAGIVDGDSPPHAGCAVEVHESAGSVAGGVLDDEMRIEEYRLAARQQRSIAIEMVPADLHHADFVF